MAPEPHGDEEIRRFEEQYRSNPDGLVFARLADAYRKEGDPDRALSLLRDGIARHPDYPSAHIVRARALVDLDRPAEAEASLRRVLELDPQNLVAMRGLSSLAEKRGDPVEAVHWYEQIATLDPMNVEAEAALERLRGQLPPTPPGLEPLPAPREEWWSSPAFELADSETVDPDADAGRAPTDAAPTDAAPAGAAPADAAPVSPVGPDTDGQPASTSPAAPLPDPSSAAPSSPGSASGGGASRGSSGAWWFEDPADEEPDEDGDLLTRTMAELYVKQGFVDEAIAIYRELLEDHPDDPDLAQALSALERSVAEPESADAEPEADVDRQPEATSDLDSAPEDAVDPVSAAAAGAAADEGSEGAPDTSLDGDEPAATRSPPVDPFATHPVPLVAATSERYREWIARLRE